MKHSFSNHFEGHLIRHKARAGCEISLQSCSPRWLADGVGWEWTKYRGFIVTHGEIETISTKLNKQVKVAFVYHVCSDGRASLKKWGHQHAPRYEMMKGYDMDASQGVCADNIGALLLHRDGQRAWWTGSLMQAQEAQRVAGLANNGANITVSAACLATIAWALKHPKRGMLFPDDFSLEDSEELLCSIEPFLGKMISVPVPSSVLPPLKQPFIETPTGVLPEEMF